MFYLINKPVGMTSFDVVKMIKKHVGTRRVGHAGTLDPLAHGCLLIATDKSTKLLPLIEWSDKTYVFTVALDGSTASLDLDTPVIYHDISDILSHTWAELEDFLLSQTEQLPPKYSALHVDGKRAYERIRNGEDFSLKIRPIIVKSVRIIDFSIPRITIELRISSGGYIRSFAPLIGEFFWLPGWYITDLQRTIIHTAKCDLVLGAAMDIESFDRANQLPLDVLFPDIVSHRIDERVTQELREWRIIKKIDHLRGIIWQKYFLNSDNFFSSLVEFWEDGFVILRNDI